MLIMRNILNIGKDIVNEIRETGNSVLLFDLFNIRTMKWKYHIISDESGTYGIFNDLENLSDVDGFNLIPTAITIINNKKDEDLFTTSLYLLWECIKLSNTAEIPNEFLKHWQSINDTILDCNVKDCMKIWEEINRWYRIN